MLKSKSLAERIVEIQAEANAFLDEKAAELSRQYPTVPLVAMRRDLEMKAEGCPCRQVLKTGGGQ